MQVKRVIYPPIWLVLGLVAVFGLNEFLPGRVSPVWRPRSSAVR
ncbi:MAG: hypothetical protein R3E54_00955 [Halioglobus sp.]